MAYDEFLADRIRHFLKQKSVFAEEKKMMGGLCFMVDDKMCFGIHIDKGTEASLLMARVGDQQYSQALENPNCTEMNFTGRSMKGYVFVSENGFDSDIDLGGWIQLCLNFNPFAKSSKKRNPKKK